MTTTATAAKVRTVRLVRPPTEDDYGLLCIVVDGVIAGYRISILDPVQHHADAAYSLVKLTTNAEPGREPTYKVLLQNGHDHCDCPDFRFGKTHNCKHLLSCRALRKAGKLA